MLLTALVILGIIAGTFGSLLGLGGGIITVPALLYLSTIVEGLHITPQIAVGTSLVVIIFTALSSTIAYTKQNKVDYQCALIFFIGSGPGSIFGAYVNKFVDIHSFNIYFGAFVIFISLLLMVKGKLKPSNKTWRIQRSYFEEPTNTTHMYGYNVSLGIFISFFVGMASGLFGIGGGTLLVPAMLLLFQFPAQVAVATSMFIIFLSSILGSLTHFYLDNINWLYVLALAPGAWLGGKLGAYISTKMKGTAIVVVFRITLIFIGVRLIWQGIQG